MERLPGRWSAIQNAPPKQFRCGYCGNHVASDKGWQTEGVGNPPVYSVIRTCPMCNRPTFHDNLERQYPGVSPGSEVGDLPPDIAELYREARRAAGASAFTASVLASRKVLMHIAVANGAKEGKSFLAYVKHLADEGYVPPGGQGWVDHIRKRGNEANHEIVVMGEPDASELLTFVEMLLKFIYEFPARVPGIPEPTEDGEN